MNEYVLRITQSAGLEKSISSKRRQLAKKENELKEIRKSCIHEVAVIIENGENDTNIYKKCLFCGIKKTSRRSFRKSKLYIDVSTLKKESHFSSEEKFQIVKDLFMKIVKENSELSIEELVNLVNEKLNVQNEEFRKMMDEFNKIEKQ